MTFYVYDPKGHQYPFDIATDWRTVDRRERVSPLEPFYEVPVKPYEPGPVEKVPPKERFESVLEKAEEKERYLYSATTPIQASQIMQKSLVQVAPGDSLRHAWALLKKGRFRHLPVVQEKRIVGLISDRTLAAYLIEGGDAASKVEEVMSAPVLTAQPTTEISHIAKVFVEEGIGAMPIVEEDGILLGVLTRTDILRTLVKVTPIKVMV